MERNIRVMLVEDNPEYRQVIIPVLEDEPDMELVGQFGTAERALDSLRDQRDCDEPDIILLDLNLPGINGLRALPLFRSAIPNSKIIILTQSDRQADVLRAITLGAAGYLLKSATLSQITEGIRTVTDGGSSLDAGVAALILDTMKTMLSTREQHDVLTEREVDVLTLLANGMERKAIAQQLNISNATVSTHVGHIYEKLDVQNAPAAVAQAFRIGLFPTEK